MRVIGANAVSRILSLEDIVTGGFPDHQGFWCDRLTLVEGKVGKVKIKKRKLKIRFKGKE